MLGTFYLMVDAVFQCVCVCGGEFSIGATLSLCTKFDCSYIVSNEMKSLARTHENYLSIDFFLSQDCSFFYGTKQKKISIKCCRMRINSIILYNTVNRK